MHPPGDVESNALHERYRCFYSRYKPDQCEPGSRPHRDDYGEPAIEPIQVPLGLVATPHKELMCPTSSSPILPSLLPSGPENSSFENPFAYFSLDRHGEIRII